VDVGLARDNTDRETTTDQHPTDDSTMHSGPTEKGPYTPPSPNKSFSRGSGHFVASGDTSVSSAAHGLATSAAGEVAGVKPTGEAASVNTPGHELAASPAPERQST